MNKKFFVSLAIILFSIFSFTICFATDKADGLGTAANGVRNFVGGTENTIENAAMGISNTSKNVTGGVENGIDGNTNRTYNTGNAAGTTNNRDGRYRTTRANTGTTVMGMTYTGWTWLIIGIAAIAIIAIVWYYSMQFTNNRHNNNNNNDD